MIHQPLSPVGVHLQISSSLRLLVLCLVRSDLFVVLLLSVYLKKKTLISFIGSLDKCHTSVFNALIMSSNGWCGVGSLDRWRRGPRFISEIESACLQPSKP